MMNDNPLISIIIPVYKVEPYLKKCLDSVIQQTYTNLEIILIDDGSPDGCPAICDEYAKEDSRVVVLHQDNAGVSVARNRGLDIAKGKYIGFVDSDDWIAPNTYEEYYKNIKANGCDISIGNMLNESEENVEKRPYMSHDFSMSLNGEDAIAYMLQDKYFGGYMMTGLYNAKLFIDVRFDENIVMMEDLCLKIKLFLKIEKISISGIPMYHYLIRQGSAARPKCINETNNSFIALEEIKKLLEGKENLLEMVEFKKKKYSLGVVIHQIIYPESVDSNIMEKAKIELKKKGKALKKHDIDLDKKEAFLLFLFLFNFDFGCWAYSTYYRLKNILLKKAY